MNLQQIADQRLINENLINPADSSEVITKKLGAIQAQDFWGACWAIGQRTNQTEAQILKDFNDSKILRTHILRPTWHFVSPADIRWIQDLTGPRVLAITKSYYKKLGLTDELLQRSVGVIGEALQGKQLTRIEIKQIYESAKIDTSGLKLGFLIMYAELTGLICSGQMQGKQHTYALLHERAPRAKMMPRDKALIELTTRFFSSHGPATIKDFAWWSSLAITDIKKGIEQANLKNFELNGLTFYFKNQPKTDFKKPVIHLLPNYDELIVGYKNRFNTLELDRAPTYEDLSYHIVTQNGQVIGGWKKQISKGTLTVKLNMFKSLNSAEQAAFDLAVSNLQNYSGLKIELK